MRRAASLILLCILCVTACREPLSREAFVKGPGPYEFSVPMNDSTVLYDFDFYTRIDASPEDIRALSDLPLTITWTSPSGQRFTESVFLPLQGRTSFFSRQIREPYRAGISPWEYGDWTMSVFVPVSASVPGMRGLGLIITKRPWDTEN